MLEPSLHRVSGTGIQYSTSHVELRLSIVILYAALSAETLLVGPERHM